MNELINREMIIKLINTPEDESHDFKQEWYQKEQKAEMVRDIFSFVNTVHNETCYLILGVSDQQTIVGVEKDPNRKNQQNMIDFISHLPIANDAIPKVYVQSIELEGHEVDIIVIPNTNNVPVYLSSKYPSRIKEGRCITPGQIFSRIGDVNTPVNEITNFYQVQSLWRKQFHLDVSIQEQYKYVLKDTDNWSYTEQEENMGFIYNLNPDFFISIENDNLDRNKVEALSIDQIKVRMGWNQLKLKYRNLTINSMLMVSIDEARYHTTVPDYAFIENIISNRPFLSLSYYRMLEDSFEYLVNHMINSAPKSFTSYGSYSSEKVKNNIVIYTSKKEEAEVHNKLLDRYTNLSELIEPSFEEIGFFTQKVKSEINIKTDYEERNIRYILRQRNLAQLINKEKLSLL